MSWDVQHRGFPAGVTGTETDWWRLECSGVLMQGVPWQGGWKLCGAGTVVSCGIPYKGCPWQVAETDVDMGWGFLGRSVEGLPCMGSWSLSRGEPGGPGALCARAALASCLELEWCGPGVFWGALVLYQHGSMAGVVS